MEFRCSETNLFVVRMNFTSLLNSVGGMGTVGTWVCGWRELNFGMGCLAPLNFGSDKNKCRVVESLVKVKHDFMNFCYVSMKFYL